MSKLEPTAKSPRETSTVKYDFTVIGNQRFKLWDHGWCDIICSQVSGMSSQSFIPADFFAALLNHGIYRQSYGLGKTEGDTHGPFSIGRLKPSDFVEVSFDEQIKYMRARYADSENFDEPPDAAQIDAIDTYLNKLPKEGMRYFRLAADHERPDYHHELWYIHTFFDEYILLNPQRETMWLMVMSYD